MMVLNKIVTFFLLLLSLYIFAQPSLALDTYVYEIPDPRQEKLWVTDLANIIKPETENKLNQMLTEVNLKYRSEIVIITVPDVSPYQNPRQLAKYIFNIWHLTRIGFNQGALFLISQSDCKGEIIANFMNDPVEPTYNDKKFQANINKITAIDISDLFVRERYEQGILLGIEELITLIKQKKSENIQINSQTFPQFLLAIITLIVVMLSFDKLSACIWKRINKYQTDKGT